MSYRKANARPYSERSFPAHLCSPLAAAILLTYIYRLTSFHKSLLSEQGYEEWYRPKTEV